MAGCAAAWHVDPPARPACGLRYSYCVLGTAHSVPPAALIPPARARRNPLSPRRTPRPSVCLGLAAALGCGADAKPAATSGPGEAPPPDLGTRQGGIDWPCFQGPHGDSVSPERGILTPWPKDGPRIVWEMKL